MDATKREYQFQAHAGLVIRERFILDYLQKKYGGTVRLQKRYKESHSPTYRWRITGNNVLNFVANIKHALRLKVEQAQEVYDFQYLKSQTKGPISDFHYERYQSYYDRMKRLNLRGVGK